MSSSEINQVDVDRLAHLWDMIHQTNTLCDVIRTLSTVLRQEAEEISASSIAKLEEKILFQKSKRRK